MTNDVSHAFAHPMERAKAIGGVRDRISMTDHIREVEIGAFQVERGVTQKIQFDVVVEVATHAEAGTDDVDSILSYDLIVTSIDDALAAERVNLLETLAARIADGILSHPLAARVFVRIGKLDRGPYTLGVEIVRDAVRGQAHLRLLADSAPQPIVVFLAQAAMARDDLATLLDRMEASATPVILCVDAPATPAPRAGQDMAQRRIDLLAIEQAAWVLAARDRRCVVVDSRTELEFAMRAGQITVWAPSKMVLDAVEGPKAQMTAPGALAVWLAQSFEAQRVIAFGAAPDDLPEAEHMAANALIDFTANA